MNLFVRIFLASFLVLHFAAEKSNALVEMKEDIEIPALLDYETGLIFYKDESIPACFVDRFSGSSFGSPVLRIPIQFGDTNKTEVPDYLPGPGLLFCKDLPVINMNFQRITLPIVRLRHYQLKKEKGKFRRGRVRRKRQSYGYYSNVPQGEARANGNWNSPGSYAGQASQAQVQGQVFGTGMFSGQAQTQTGGMSQSQVQLSGVGIRGQISSSSGNAQAQLSLGNGAGSGQASGLGNGPSNSQVQVTLGQGNEESMASASVTSGGTSTGIGSGPLTSGGGYYGSSRGHGSGGTEGNGYQHGNGYAQGFRTSHGSPGGVPSGHYLSGGTDQFAQNERNFPQHQTHYGGQSGTSAHYQGSPGAQNLHGTGIGGPSQGNGVIQGGGIGGSNGQGNVQQGYPGFGSSHRIQGTNNGQGVGYGNGFGGPFAGTAYGGGPGGSQGSQGGIGPSGPPTDSGSIPGAREQGRYHDFSNHQPQLQSGGFRDHSSITPGGGLPGSAGTTRENGNRGSPVANGGLQGSGTTSGIYPNGIAGGGRPHVESRTPGAYASSHGIGQAQAQTAYFGNSGNGQYVPYSYFQDGQPTRGRSNIDGVQRFQDQQVGYGAGGQRHQAGGSVPGPTSIQNGYRATTPRRNGNGLSTTYTSSGRTNGAQYTNGGRSTSHRASSTVPQLHGPITGAGGTPISGSGLSSPSRVNGYRTDSNLQETGGTTISTGRQPVPGHSQSSPSTAYIPSTISSQQNGQQHRAASATGGGYQTTYQARPISPQASSSTGSVSQHISTGAVRNGQPYRINGLGQVIPAGHGRHPISPTTTTITGGVSGVDSSHTGTHEQSGLFPSYGVSRVSPDDPDGNKCTIITFSCTIVIESNGRAKICKPNAVRVNNNNGGSGSGRHNRGSSGTNGSKICCC